MDVQCISRECAFSESSLTLLTRQQESSAFQIDSPAGTNSRPISIRRNNRTAIVKGPSYTQPPQLLWTLPQKRSNQTLALERVEPERSHPRAFSGIHSAKRFKGPITPPLPSPLSSCNNVVTTGLSRPLLDFSEAKSLSPERAEPAESTGDQLDSDRPKTLRSPFEYTKELVTSQVDPNAKNDIHRFNPNGPVRSEKSSGYIYYAPTNPSNKTNQALDAHRRVPRRQLSYGDPPSKTGPRSLHKTTGSRELRYDAERHAEDFTLDSWSDRALNPSAAGPYRSELMRSEPRLWLDLAEQEDTIQEAVSILKRQEMQT